MMLPRIKNKRALPRKHPEDDLQGVLCALLTMHERMGKLMYFHVPNGGYRHLREAQRLQGLGVRAGVPDLVITFKFAQAMFWEVKEPTHSGTLIGEQLRWQERLTQQGFSHYVIRSVRDAEAALQTAFRVQQRFLDGAA